MLIKLKGNYKTQEVWLNGKKLNLKRSLTVANHAQTGFAWGYNGSGPAQLAAAICLELVGKKEFSKTNYQQLKFDIISILPQTNFDTQIEIDAEKYL